MNREKITLDVQPKTIVVTDGQIKGARLWFQAAGLDIFVNGRVCKCREHQVKFLAVSEAVARHIPALTVKDVREPRKKKIQPKNPAQRSMF